MQNFFKKNTYKPQIGRLPVFIKNHDKLNFKVPSLFSNDSIMFELLSACKHFEISLPINCTYGSVKCDWNGGRSSKIREFNEEEISRTLKNYHDFGITTCFTFTNYHINENMLDNNTGNLMLEIASEYDNSYVIVSSDILASYIKAKYPKIKLESSLLRPTYEIRDYSEKPKYYDDLCERFDKVMIRPELGQDISFMKKIKNKDKIDILVNSNCVYKCPFSVAHYNRAVDLESEKVPENTVMCNSRFYNKKSLYENNLLSNNDIDKLAKIGYKNFKLNGRNINEMLFLHILGTYIFDSSGIYTHLLNYMSLVRANAK